MLSQVKSIVTSIKMHSSHVLCAPLTSICDSDDKVGLTNVHCHCLNQRADVVQQLQAKDALLEQPHVRVLCKTSHYGSDQLPQWHLWSSCQAVCQARYQHEKAHLQSCNSSFGHRHCALDAETLE